MLSFHRFKTIMTSVGVCAILAGCANSATEASKDGIASAKAAADREIVKSRYTAPDAPSGPLRERNGLFLAGATHENAHGSGLPGKYATRKFTFINSTPMSFREITDLITRQTDMPVVSRFTSPHTTTSAAPATAGDITRAPTMAQGPLPAGFDANKALAAAGGAANYADVPRGGAALGQADANSMNVNYTGTLPGFLDLVGDTFGLGWEYEDGRLAFTRTQVATFDVPALPIVMKLAFSLDSTSSSTTGGGGSGAQQTGGSSQKAATDAAFNLWTDIDKTIHSIVATDGSVDISGSTGTITVNAPSVVVKQVRKYIQRINRELSREIVMGVDVYAVTLAKGDNYNFDLNVAFTNAAEKGLGLGGAMGPAGAAAISSGSALATVSSILTNASTANGAAASTPSIGASVLNPNSKYYGSNALLSALSTQGDVSVVTSVNLTTLNGIPAPFQVVNTRGYVASVATTVTGASTGGSQTTLTPGSVTTGFNLYMVPRVDRNGTVLIQYGINISDLVGATNGFDVFSSGGQTVQLPNINARNFVQEASVPAGGTLVLTGFEQKSDKTNLGGVGDASFPFLGGSNVSSHGRTIIVLSITPRIVSFGQNNSVD